jgi:hypothetical protein
MAAESSVLPSPFAPIVFTLIQSSRGMRSRLGSLSVDGAADGAAARKGMRCPPNVFVDDDVGLLQSPIGSTAATSNAAMWTPTHRQPTSGGIERD